MVRQGSFNDTPARPRRSPGGKVGMALVLYEVMGSDILGLCVWSIQLMGWTVILELIVYGG